MSARCRVFLREFLGSAGPLDAATKVHVEGCPFCRARASACDRLIPGLVARPQGNDRGVDLLALLRERIIEQAEESVLGKALDESMPVAVPVVEEAGWPGPLLDSELARRAEQPPPQPSATAWVRVRGAILAQVSSGSVRDRRRVSSKRNVMLAAGGVACVLVVALLAVSQDRVAPSITFLDLGSRDLASMSTVDFAVLRYGATR